MKMYEVVYDNGAHSHIEVESLVDAIQQSRLALLSCLPIGFDSDLLVKPIMARETTTFICQTCHFWKKGKLGYGKCTNSRVWEIQDPKTKIKMDADFGCSDWEPII